MPTANCSRPDDTNWTGAEVKSCCRLASLLDVPLVQAAQNVVPVAMNTISRMSPPHPGHCSGNSSPHPRHQFRPQFLAGAYERAYGNSTRGVSEG